MAPRKRVARSAADQAPPPVKRKVLEDLVSHLGLDMADLEDTRDAPLAVSEVPAVPAPAPALAPFHGLGVQGDAHVVAVPEGVPAPFRGAQGEVSVDAVLVPAPTPFHGVGEAVPVLAPTPLEIPSDLLFPWGDLSMSSSSSSTSSSTSLPSTQKNTLDLNAMISSSSSSSSPPLPPRSTHKDTLDLNTMFNQSFDAGQVQDVVRELDLPATIEIPFHRVAVPSSFPLQCVYRDFPITKNGSKLLRQGVDLMEQTPFVLMLSETNKNGSRLWVRMSPAELQILNSKEIITLILEAFKKQALHEPILVGDLTLNLAVNAKKKHLTTLSVHRKDSPFKIFLAESSWRMVEKLRENMGYHMKTMIELASLTQTHWPTLLSQCRTYCATKEKTESFLCEALKSQSSPFPVTIIYDMMCYHMDYFKNQMVSTK